MNPQAKYYYNSKASKELIEELETMTIRGIYDARRYEIQAKLEKIWEEQIKLLNDINNGKQTD